MPLHSLSAWMFFLVCCLGGLGGYEGMWTDLAAFRYDVAYVEDLEDESAVSWPVVGRFKSEHGIDRCYMIPIAGTTNSGITFFRWTQRFIAKLSHEGRHKGWAFQHPNGARALASDYQVEIFSKLEIIQATIYLIDPQYNIWTDYGVQRSGRRFPTSHATNMGVEPQ